MGRWFPDSDVLSETGELDVDAAPGFEDLAV